SAYYRTLGERVGVHPYLRFGRAPRELLAYAPEHLLVGHGAGLHGPNAAGELHRAIRQAGRRSPLLPLILIPRRLGAARAPPGPRPTSRRPARSRRPPL